MRIVAITIACVAMLAPAPLMAQRAKNAPDDPGEAAYQEGRRLYDLREWDRAIERFKTAYELRHDAASLFNIAQAYRLKGDCVEALGFYKTYVRNFPDEENRVYVEKFITDLAACADKQAQAVKTKAEPAPAAGKTVVQPLPAPAPPDGHRKLALGITAAGGAAVAASLVVGALARSKWNAALSHCDADLACDEQGLALGDQARTRATIATVVGGAGITAAAAGIVLYVLQPRRHESGVAIAPIATPSHLGITAMARF